MDAVDLLVLDEAPRRAERVVVVDSAPLAAVARERWHDVVEYGDVVAFGNEARTPVEFGDEVLAGADLVLGRLPKGLGALEEQAERIAAWANPDVRVVWGGRVKHMTRSMNDVIARSFAEVHASLARDKSRVLHATGATPHPFRWPKSRREPTTGLTLVAHGATFAGPRLDAGTALLLSTAERWGPGAAVDLGCGNGVVAGVLATQRREVIALDNSRAAIASTLATARANGLAVDARLGWGLLPVADASVDLVVTNPPFHVGTTKDSTPTLAMLADAARVLRPGGELWVVYNAHLPYLPALRHHFDDVRIAARDRSYLVVAARRPVRSTT